MATFHLPEYSFIAPNLCNDAHNWSLGTADSWLQNNIDPLLKNPGAADPAPMAITASIAFSTTTSHKGSWFYRR